jgi:hypothetical protein
MRDTVIAYANEKTARPADEEEIETGEEEEIEGKEEEEIEEEETESEEEDKLDKEEVDDESRSAMPSLEPFALFIKAILLNLATFLLLPS